MGGQAAGQGVEGLAQHLLAGDLAGVLAPVQVGSLQRPPGRRHHQGGIEIVGVLSGSLGDGGDQAPLDLVGVAGHGGHELRIRTDQPHAPQVAIGIVQPAGELRFDHGAQGGEGVLVRRPGQQLLLEALHPLRSRSRTASSLQVK